MHGALIYLYQKAHIYTYTHTHTYIYIASHVCIYVALWKVSHGLSLPRAGITVSPSAVAVARAGLAFPQPLGFLLQAGARVSGPETG